VSGRVIIVLCCALVVACGDATTAVPDDVAAADATVNTDVGPSDDGGADDAGADAVDDAPEDADATDVGGGDSGADADDDAADAASVDATPDAADAADAADSEPTPPVAVSLYAPFAESVEIVASFDDWVVPGRPLERDDEGWWRADVPARDGDAWRFIVRRLGDERWLADPSALQLVNDWDDAVYRTDPGAGAVDVDPARLVLYEVHPGTFRAPGGVDDGSGFTRIEQGLPWLASLGVNGIAMMPVHEFVGDRSWGYNPSWPFAVERTYGGFDGLVALTRAAHDRRIAVLADFVMNHLASESPLCRVDTEPDESCGGGWIAPWEVRDTPWGPRPAFAPASVRDWWARQLAHYVTTLGFDGVRFDATVYVRTVDGSPAAPWDAGEAVLRAATDALRAARPGGVWIAEDLQGDARITTSVRDGGFGFDLQWDARWHGVVRDLLLADPGARDIDRLWDVIDDGSARVIYLESHDTTGRLNRFLREPHNVRLPDDLALDPALADAPDAVRRRLAMATVWLFASPGTPMLLQGQEWWQGGAFHDDAPIAPALAEDRPDVVALHRDLITARTGGCDGCGGLTSDTVRLVHRHPDVGVLAWARGSTDPVLVVTNLGATDFPSYRVGVPADGVWRVVADSSAIDVAHEPLDPIPADAVPWDAEAWSLTVPLPAESALVLVRDSP